MMFIFVFHGVFFFCNYKVNLGVILYLTKQKIKIKMWAHVYETRRHVGGTSALRAMHIMPLGVQIYLFSMLLEKSLCLLVISATYVSLGDLICR